MEIWTSENNQTLVLKERFDKKKLQFILENWNDTYIQTTLHKFSSIKNEEGEEQSNINQLKTLYKKYLKVSNSDGTVQTVLRQRGSKNRKGGLMGRYFANGSLSLQNITRPVRQTICKDFYWDIDIVNCHPQILYQYCKKHSIDCPTLEIYVKERDDLIKRSTLTKDTFKKEFLAILNGRSFDRKYRIQEVDDFFVSWNLEASNILEKVVSLNKDIKASKKDYNENGSITNKYICSIENKIIFETFNWLVRHTNEYEPEVLCFDGLMIRKKGELEDLERALVDLSKYLLTKTEYKVDFSVKPMEDSFDLSKITPKINKDKLGETLEFDNSIQELKLTIEKNEGGFADLFKDLYANDNIKFTSCEHLTGYVWQEDTCVWFPFNGPTYLSRIVTRILVNHIIEQIGILEKIKSLPDNVANPDAQKGIQGCIEHFKKTMKNVSTFKMAQSILKLISSDLLDRDFSTSINNYEDVLPISEGKKINLRTLEITERTIEDRFDHELSINYTQDEKENEVIDSLMTELMDIHRDNMEEDDKVTNHNAITEKQAFQVILGYMISGCNKEKMYTVWHGPSGNNGKSTLASLITGVFGVYAKSFDKSIIEQVNKSKGNSHNSALMATKGVHIGFIHETEAQMPISSADIKALTSGGQDTISARECRGKQEEFLPRFKLAILCNKKPKINGSDPALASRTRYIPFLNKFENSSENIKKIDNIKNNFRDAFFSWCVNGAKKYFDTGVLPKTDLQKSGEQQFIQENDTLQSFINEFCNVGEFTLDSEGNQTQYKARYKCSDFKKDFLQQNPESIVKELGQDLLAKNKKFKSTTVKGYPYYNFISKKATDAYADGVEYNNINPML